MAVISAKTELFRLDIDDENFIHHLKASDPKDFGLWLEQLQQHRFYRQNQINSMPDKEDPGKFRKKKYKLHPSKKLRIFFF